jgi:hypothetical protein
MARATLPSSRHDASFPRQNTPRLTLRQRAFTHHAESIFYRTGTSPARVTHRFLLRLPPVHPGIELFGIIIRN